MASDVDLPLDQFLAARLPSAIRSVQSWSRQQRAAAAEGAVDLIAGRADALFAAPGGPSSVAGEEVRGALVRGLAILAQRPEGVTLGGLTWTRDGDRSGQWSLAPVALSRQARGAWFTPRSVAETVTAGALTPLTRHASAFDIVQLSVADISCGSGAFLVAAARHLAEALTDAWERDPDVRDEALLDYCTNDVNLAARATVLDACIYGVDIDPLSADLARIALQLLVPDRRAPAAVDRIKVGDALVGEAYPGWHADATYPPGVPRFDWPQHYPYVITPDRPNQSGFSAVIGNPPYLGGQRLTSTYGTAYREYLVDVIAGGQRGSADLAAYFLIRAAELCQDLGVIGLIATNTLVQGATARTARAGLDHLSWQLHQCQPLAWPATTASVHCVIVWLHCMRVIADDLRASRHELPVAYV